MSANRILILTALVAALGLSGCDTSSGLGKLLKTDNTKTGPDEFSILPNKPLEMPESLTDLPEPNPGAANRADLTPDKDAVAALGGKPALLDSTAVSGSEQALINTAGRYGVSPNIRQTLATEDKAFRAKNKGTVLERLFNTDVYLRSYEGVSLAANPELARLRQLGQRTPAAPPAHVER